jgi:hypothetical protein
MLNDEDSQILKAIAGAASATAGLGSIGLGSIPVATVTTTAPGILGVLGFTTTTVVALPAVGIVAGVGLAAFGVKKVFFDDKKPS